MQTPSGPRRQERQERQIEIKFFFLFFLAALASWRAWRWYLYSERCAGYICSGCSIPSRSNPSAIVRAVSSHSASRLDAHRFFAFQYRAIFVERAESRRQVVQIGAQLMRLQIARRFSITSSRRRMCLASDSSCGESSLISACDIHIASLAEDRCGCARRRIAGRGRYCRRRSTSCPN